jgi:hypothetical protein
MREIAACFLLVLVGGSVALAQEPSCQQVRDYVGQVGVKQARIDGRAKGMTSEQEGRAAACLGKGRTIAHSHMRHRAHG